MHNNENREHQRCTIDTSIRFSFYNQTKTYPAVARDYSHSGMYFETNQKLQPGVIIIIRPQSCGSTDSGDYLPLHCGPVSTKEPACNELKSLVSGRVIRCQPIRIDDAIQYGVAVEYVSPSV